MVDFTLGIDSLHWTRFNF